MEKTRVYLLTHHTYYASMLSQCTFGWSKEIPTAGIKPNLKGNFDLLMNKDFFYEKCTPPMRVGLLMHEMLHIAMKHVTRGKEYMKEDPYTANCAMDMAINQYIPKKYLPPNPILPEQYNQPANKPFEYYYRELKQNKQFQQDKQKNQEQSMDEHGWDQPPQDNKMEQEGDQEGNSTGEGKESKGKGKPKPGNGKGKQQSMSALPDYLQEKMIDQMVKKAIKQAGKLAGGTDAGTVPQAVEQMLDESADVPEAKVNWNRETANAVGKHLSDKREPSRTRPNRRVGLLAPGQKRTPAPKVFIGEDESGSVGDALIQEFRKHIPKILEAVKEKVEVLFFDTEVQKVLKINKLGKEPRFAAGGTNFDCVMRYANKHKCDLLIMFTDGYAPAPTVKPGCPVIWVLSTPPEQNQHLTGKKIFIHETEDVDA